MHISCLIYHFLEAALFWNVSGSFWFFFLIINRESHSVVFVQMRRDYKITFTDKSKANLRIHLDLGKVHRLKGLTSLYIISYLHFLNLNNILGLPKTGRRWSWVWFDTYFVRLVFCLPDLCACALVYEIKTNVSRLYSNLAIQTKSKDIYKVKRQ